MHQEIPACRLCGNTELIDILDLGIQFANDLFPKSNTERLAAAPLKLVKCNGEPAVCGLVQLGHARNANESCIGLEALQVLEHLRPEDHKLLAAFCGEATSHVLVDERKVLATSPSILSALEQPKALLSKICETLDACAVCIVREPYMPSMLQANAYDFVGHEHHAYYALKQISRIAEMCGLKIVNVRLAARPGSIASIVLSRRESRYEPCASVERMLDEEARDGLHTLQPYRAFAQRVIANVSLLRMFLDRAKQAGKSVHALGATKEGNVILQSCRATRADITQVGETDLRKVGAFTPGSLLPIVLEEDVLAAEPDFLLVLAWKLQNFLR